MRILIVDDNPGTRNAFRIGLISMGFQIKTAAGGEEALHMIRETLGTKESPDLLLTDQRMPNMNGLELVQHVRELMPELPVILMTAYGDAKVKASAQALYGCGYLDKPFTAQDLLNTIQDMKPSPVISAQGN